MAIAKHLSARQFVSIVLACTLAWLGIGIVSELSLGTFRPWLQGYRFAGIFHPNIMGVNCALLIMASLYLVVVGARLKNGLLHVIAGVTFAFLLLTGSRTALGAMLVSIAALWFITAPASKKLVYLLFPGLVVVFVGVAAGLGAFEDFADVIAMGRNDSEMSSLTGRVPLWQELLNNYLPLNPLAGHGYGAFWTENHIAEISHYQTWAVYHAHSTYIDLVLNVGLIGAALYLTGMVLAFLSASRLEARHVRGGYGFVVMMIVYGLTAGLLESHVGSTWFFSFFGVCGICYLVFRDDRETQSASPDTESPRIRAQSFARTAT
ncbi:MAG: O-antigen ligase family protein [Pirellulales bacterium]